MANKGFAHESVDNLSVDWYTPKWVFDRLGLTFDLDPCAPSSEIFKPDMLRALDIHPSDYIGGVPWIPCKKVYTLANDGLSQPWIGRVWLNPPYGKNTPDWLEKMHLHRDGVALVFARTDCAWFHNFVAKADAILFLKGRVRFVDGLGVSKGSGAGSGSMLVAWGSDCVAALQNMSDLGKLILLTGES